MRRYGSVLLFAALSLALHLVWMAWMPESRRPALPETQWVELSFEEAPAEVAAADEAKPVDEPQLTAASVQPPPVNPKPTQRRPSVEQVQPSAVPPVQPVPAQPTELQLEAAAPAAPPAQPTPTQPQLAATEHAAPSGTPKTLDLLPRSAALSLDPLARPSGLRCGERASPEASDCAPTQAETGRAAQSALTRDLNGIASHVPHLKPREHPVLKRRSDGSYTYESGVFQAVVRPDGKVEFRDTSIRSELHLSWVPFTVVADLNDVVERDVLGRELYSAEKQWLLDETRELRAKLAGEARRRELLDANRALERTLRGILDDHALSVARKHEAVFLIWQDCGEDGDAVAHRRAVDSFVRRYMAKGSALEFHAEELERLNGGRPGLQPFAPYAGS